VVRCVSIVFTCRLARGGVIWSTPLSMKDEGV
jgi:hypothetical protein